jgi:hypothetical protein
MKKCQSVCLPCQWQARADLLKSQARHAEDVLDRRTAGAADRTSGRCGGRCIFTFVCPHPLIQAELFDRLKSQLSILHPPQITFSQ